MSTTSPILVGFLGSLVAGAGTGLGALPIFLRAQWSSQSQRVMLAVAGGMMLGATFFSLLQPALDLVHERGGSPASAAGTAALGTLLGALALWAAHGAIPHAHFSKGQEGRSAFQLGRNTLFVLAIALHNFPEGLSVGVAYGHGASAAGHTVALSILAQNLPEGLAVAAALIVDGTSRGRAFWIALLTGLVEPIGGLFGAFAVSISDALLPWGLSFAAGAMLFVVSGEVIPETHVEGQERSATFAIIVGFVAMMGLAVLLG
jgi:ZIP family zinc transporter